MKTTICVFIAVLRTKTMLNDLKNNHYLTAKRQKDERKILT